MLVPPGMARISPAGSHFSADAPRLVVKYGRINSSAGSNEMKGLVFLLLTSISAVGQVSDKVKAVTFDRADAQHCRVVIIEGRPMLQTVYGGTSVAVGLPVSTGGLDFRVFVVVREVGPGKALQHFRSCSLQKPRSKVAFSPRKCRPRCCQNVNMWIENARVEPKEFSALYSDPAHTRFWFYDKAAEVDRRTVRQGTQESAIVAASSQGDSGMPGVPPAPDPVDDKDRQARAQRMRDEDPNAPAREQEEAREEKQSKSLSGSTMTPDQLYLRRSTLRQGSFTEGFVYFRKPKGSKLNVGSRDLLFEIDIPVNGVVFRFS
jgi:hypothetical protein